MTGRVGWGILEIETIFFSVYKHTCQRGGDSDNNDYDDDDDDDGNSPPLRTDRYFLFFFLVTILPHGGREREGVREGKGSQRLKF